MEDVNTAETKGCMEMINCQECCRGKARAETQDVYKDDLLGIPVIILHAAVQEKCVACGAVLATVIPDLDGLIAAVAVTRAMEPAKLTGVEIRFLRKAIGLTGKALAEALEVKPETLSRWENGKDVMGPTSEKLLRMVTAGVLGKKAPAVDIDLPSIVDMRIQSVRATVELPEMIFERVKVKLDERKKKENHWDHADRKVA
jgi:DNA-binding transcriptional regulator YiaG